MPEELSKLIDRVIQKRPLYKEALSVYRDLLIFLDESEPKVTCVLKDEELHDIRVKEGFPLFSRETLPLDLKAASSLFYRLAEHLSSRRRKDKEGLKKLLAIAQSNSKWIKDGIDAFLAKDGTAISKMAEAVGLEPTVLRFLIHMALKPSLSNLRETVSAEIQKDSWDYGYCPLCGSSPDMAYLNDQGKRFLHCELCGFEWPYPRLTCPFCGNDDHKKLGYFASEEEEGFRVDFCKKCNFYIKTLDMRVIESPAPLEVENLVTLHLDVLADEQGFKSQDA
jgi:FdhE protein